MGKVYEAVTASSRGDFSKRHVYHPDKVPIELKIEQRELIPILLIERERQKLEDFKEPAKGELKDDESEG